MEGVLSAGTVDAHEQSSLHDAEVGQDMNLIDEPLLVLLDIGLEVEMDVVD